MHTSLIRLERVMSHLKFIKSLYIHDRLYMMTHYFMLMYQTNICCLWNLSRAEMFNWIYAQLHWKEKYYKWIIFRLREKLIENLFKFQNSLHRKNLSAIWPSCIRRMIADKWVAITVEALHFTLINAFLYWISSENEWGS